MSNVVNLDSQRPHLVIDSSGFGGSVRVYPVAYFEDLVAGKPVEPIPDDALRQIIAEWLLSRQEFE